MASSTSEREIQHDALMAAQNPSRSPLSLKELAEQEIQTWLAKWQPGYLEARRRVREQEKQNAKRLGERG